MYSDFKYKLEPYKGQSTRHACPSCRAKKNFARYIDVNGDYVGDDIGRCNSEIHCGYHSTPKGNEVITRGFNYVPLVTTYLRNKDVSKEQFNDNLFKYLSDKFGDKAVRSVYSKYHVCSSNEKWRNSTVFYQIDNEHRFRTGKIILYGSDGKRIKEPYSHIYWSHNKIKDFEFVLEQCLFGEHLLDGFHGGNIYLVESEKTCIIASLFYKDDLFVATGGLSNLSKNKLKILNGYDVEAIPDKGGYNHWKKKLEPLGITVNTVMEDSDAPDGSDIADLLID